MNISVSHSICIHLLLALFLASTSSQSAQSQAFSRVEDTNTNVSNYYYYYDEPGIATIRIHVLGAARQPGLYEISENTDLGELLALSGGPSVGARAPDIRNDITLQVFRSASGERQLVYEQQMDRSLGGATTYPMLIDGDVVVLDMVQHQRFSWRDITRVVSSIAIVALSADRLSRAFRN